MLSFLILAACVVADTAASDSAASSVSSATAAAKSTPLAYGNYTMAEFAQLPLLKRITTYPWQLEKITVAVIAAYVLSFFYGADKNKKMVEKVVDAIVPTLKDNFYQVGVTTSSLVAKDDAQHYTLYATGRLRIASFTARFVLQARENLFMWLIESVMSFFVSSIDTPKDSLTMVFAIDKPTAAKFDNFVWAIVTKDQMNKYRKDNYFLSLTQTSESDKLPNEFVFMNEVAEMNDTLYSKKWPALLERTKEFLEFVAITDMPADKPESVLAFENAGKKVIVQLKVPKSDEDVAAVSDLVSFLLNDYIDFVCNNATFRPELTRRCRKTRSNELGKLQKAEEDARKEALQEKRLEEQRKKDEKLTPQQQEKLQKRREERRQRKQMKGQRVHA